MLPNWLFLALTTCNYLVITTGDHNSKVTDELRQVIAIENPVLHKENTPEAQSEKIADEIILSSHPSSATSAKIDLVVVPLSDKDFPEEKENGTKTVEKSERIQHDDPFSEHSFIYKHKGLGLSNLTNRVKVFKAKKRRRDLSWQRSSTANPQHIVGSLSFQPANPCELLCSGKIETLEHRVDHLEKLARKQSQAMQSYENKIRQLETGVRGCIVNGKKYAEGETFPGEQQCSECTCHNSELFCRPLGCKPLSCSHPEKAADDCCPVCKSECTYMGKTYEHGHSTRPKPCVVCSCNDGDMMCKYEQPTECPSLGNCPLDKVVTPPNHCCAVCQDDDFCRQKPCHGNATCVNLPHDRECRCSLGYFGSGEQCFDIDECKVDRDIAVQLGDRCGIGTRCMNTPGSFMCECLPGFSRIDARTCIDLLLF